MPITTITWRQCRNALRYASSLLTLALLTSALFVSSALVANAASAETPPGVARVELLPFQTETLSDAEFLTTDLGPEATIAGALRLPFKPKSEEKLPAVILMHGSSGYGGYVDDWVQRLNAMGIATFVPDSVTGRGLAGGVGSRQSALGRLATTKDAYRALEILSEDPRIDPERIVLMGFSRGGQAALYAGLTRFQKLHLHGDGHFAAIIAFYPNCTYRYLQDEKMADIPIRIFHGKADDYNPFNACETYVRRLQEAGNDVQITGYLGAYHVFDWKGLPEPVSSPKAQSSRDCNIKETKPGLLTNLATGQPFSYDDACVRTGTTAGYNAAAATHVKKAVPAFLQQILKLPKP